MVAGERSARPRFAVARTVPLLAALALAVGGCSASSSDAALSDAALIRATPGPSAPGPSAPGPSAPGPSAPGATPPTGPGPASAAPTGPGSTGPDASSDLPRPPSPIASSVSTMPDHPTTSLACVRELPKAVRIGQTMLVTTTGVSRVREWLAQGWIAGILVNGRLSAPTATALRAATSDRANRYGALLAADEEGGGVQRYAGLIGSIPSEQRLGWSMTSQQVEQLWTRHAAALAEWGVDLVLAPVVDVGHGPGIGSRSYSSTPGVVAEYGRAAAQGIAQAGLLPVLKHFPGHGRASGDSHDAAVTGPELGTLRTVDLVPYKRILATGPEVGVLVGHTTVPGLTAKPGSQSPRVIDGLLRDRLGFDGLVVSDALGMAAAGQPTQGDALVGFLAAGGDLGIVGPYGSVQGRAAVVEALADGDLSWDRVDQAAARVLAVKGLDPCALAAGERAGTQAGKRGRGGGHASSTADPETPGDAGLPPDPPVVNPSEAP